MSGQGPDIVLDVSRLATRFNRAAPNGIDRVDLAYARHFLSQPDGAGAVLLGPLGPRLVGRGAAHQIALTIERHWREGAAAELDPAYRDVRRRLGSSLAPAPGRPPERGLERRSMSGSIGHLLMRGGLFGRQGLWPGRSLVRSVPRGAVYLNVSQFPIWIDRYFEWLRRRPDIKAVFFLHDLLPVEYPEFFPPAEAARHAARLDSVARRAAGVIVATAEIAEKFADHVRSMGRREIPTCVMPLPPAPEFTVAGDVDPELAGRDYFVVCGTIEPRKNHLLLLNIWRELARELGEATPKLVLVGSRGWDNENVIDMLERCDSAREHVIESGRLSSPALRNLLMGARALLMPSFAEGYGLPVVEAMAAGAPVIASNINSFRTLRRPGLTLIDAIDGPAWMAEIKAALASERRSPTGHKMGSAQILSWSLHLGHVESFVRQL